MAASFFLLSELLCNNLRQNLHAALASLKHSERFRMTCATSVKLASASYCVQ